MPRITYVRVRDNGTKHEYSVVASAVDADAMTVLKDKPATRADGTPLPPKHHKSLSSLSSTKGRKADTEGREATVQEGA